MSQLYNAMTVNELESKYPGIPWREYIMELLKPLDVEFDERVLVWNPNYMESLSELLSKTPKRVLANYAIWRVVLESVPFLNERFQKIQAKFNAHYTGTEEQGLRWERCIHHLADNIPLAAGALYVREVFDKNLKKEVEELVERVGQSFEKSFEKADWMDRKTKMAALKKLKSMYGHVGYPDELMDNKKLDIYFKTLKRIPDSYLDSYLSLSLLEINNAFQKLGKSYNKTTWVTHGSSAVVNAHYSIVENSFQIPAAYIQEEFFVVDRPNYMNYGAMGSSIGHEIAHAFDDVGSQYDERGNLANWWNPETLKEYQKRVQCIAEQYGNYTIEEVELDIDGYNTQEENMSDNVGIMQAYLAYEEYERQNGPEPRLPGLPYSPRQLFWLSYANVYCESNTPEELKHQITVGSHSPSEFRIIGAYSNMPKFARDFQCPLGSFMNPFKKCTVW